MRFGQLASGGPVECELGKVRVVSTLAPAVWILDGTPNTEKRMLERKMRLHVRFDLVQHPASKQVSEQGPAERTAVIAMS